MCEYYIYPVKWSNLCWHIVQYVNRGGVLLTLKDTQLCVSISMYIYPKSSQCTHWKTCSQLHKMLAPLLIRTVNEKNSKEEMQFYQFWTCCIGEVLQQHHSSSCKPLTTITEICNVIFNDKKCSKRLIYNELKEQVQVGDPSESMCRKMM